MISYSVSHGTKPFGKGVFTSFFLFLFILIFGLTSELSAQSTPRGASGGAVINAETWEALGSGVTGEVFALAQMGDYLYVGGDLTAAGGSPVNNIARYHLTNGNWEALGLGVDGRVNSLVAHNGVLYVGGEFEQVNGAAGMYFTTFDGTNWSTPTDQPVLTGSSGKVSVMLVLDGYVYVGGDFDAIGGLSTTTIARYSINGGTWEAVTPSPSFFTSSGCSVIAMATDGTSIYMSVPCAAEIGGQTYSGLFSYTPGTSTWAPVGEGLDEFSAPLGLAVHDGFLYAAGYGMYVGDFILGTSGDPDVEFFGRYDLSTPSSGWASLGDPLDDAAMDFVIADGSAYVIGQFTSIDALSSQGMAVLDLETLNWSSIGALNYTSNGGGAGNNVIELIGNKLVVGGVIENAGGVEVSNVARYTKTFTGGGSGGDGGSGGGDGGGSVSFTLTAPSNGATGVPVNPLFTWNAPEGVTPDYYTLEIFDNAELDGFPILPFGEITTNQYQYDSEFGFDLELFGNTTYYWRVTGYNNLDEVVANTEAPFSFTTIALDLATPTLVAPADDATDVSLTPTFTWSKDALAEAYVLEYSTGATLSETHTQVNLALADLTDADPNYSYTLPEGSALTAGTQYSWRIISKKTGLDDKPSAESSFTTDDMLPGAFAFTAPTGNSFDSFPLELAWNESVGATGYELSIKIGDTFITNEESPLTTSERTYSLDNTYFVDGFTYTFELTAVNEFGETSAEPKVVTYTPIKPVASSPKDGSIVLPGTSFEWTSTENFGFFPGTVMVQILFSNDTEADPQTNQDDGIHFEFQGESSNQESKTLSELIATQEERLISEVLSRTGQTLYWRVSNKSINFANQDRQVVWSDLASFTIPVPTAITLSGQETITAGETSNLFTIQVVDAEGNPSLVNQHTLFSLSTSAGESGVFDPIGTVTIPSGQSSGTFTYSDTKAGEKTLTVTYVSGDSNLDESVSEQKSLTVLPAEPSIVTAIDAENTNNQRAVVGTAVSNLPSVLVSDQYGNGIASTLINFEVTGGGGSSLPNSAVQTDINGIATATSWTLGPNPGMNTLSASLASNSNVGQTFTATGVPVLAFTNDLHTTKIGDPTDLITIQLRSSTGDPVTLSESATINLSVNPDDGLSFRNSDNTGDITQLVIPAGQSSASFRARSTSFGSKAVTASYLGISTATQNVLVHPFESGTGTELDPYIIVNVDQLQAVNSFQTAYFKLGNDIDASATRIWNSGEGFNPIRPGMGFDGDFKVIRDLYINRPTSDNVGLFSYNGVTIKNLGVVDATIIGRNNVGGLVGYSRGSANITTSFSSGSVKGRDEVGGLIGYGDDGRVDNSYSHSSVDGNSIVGGLIGYTDRIDIFNSYAKGFVNGNSSSGGLVGSDRDGYVSRSNNFWDVQTTNQSSTADNIGAGRTTAQMKTQSTFGAWDFVSTWAINPRKNDGYPYIQGFEFEEAALPASKLAFSTSEVIVKVDEISSLVTVEIQNDESEPVSSSEAISVDLSFDYPIDFISFLHATEESEITQLQIPAGQSSAQFRVRSTRFGQFELIASTQNLTAGRIALLFHQFASGSGKESDPFIITTLDELQAMARMPDQNYALANDIDASSTKEWNNGAGFEPIMAFSGSFDGKGFKISGLYVDKRPIGDFGRSFAGMFGSTRFNSVVKNVVLKNVSIRGESYVGGLVGQNVGAVERSYVQGDIFSSGNYVGGLVGLNEGSINRSHTAGSVYGESNVGGLVGVNQLGQIVNSFSQSYSSARVNVVGGLVGLNTSTITNSYSTGEAIGNISGGLVGGDNDEAATSGFWDTESSKNTYSEGGTGKTTTQMKTQSTFTDAGWDFEDIWAIDPAKNRGYPYLKDLYVEDSPQLLLITLVGPGSSDSDVPENVTLRPTFTWEALTDLENVYYILEVSKNEDFSTLFGSATTQNVTSMIESDLDGPTTYYWRVKAVIGVNGNEIVGQSATRSFKTNTGIELVSLDNEATNVDLNSVFEWYSNDSQFFLSIQEPGTAKILAVNLSPTKRYTLQEVIDNRLQNLNPENTLKNLEPEKTYEWSVSRFDAQFNFLGNSETRTFTTSAAFGIDPPVLNTPVETNLFSFSWSGDETAQYVFEIDDDKENLESAGPSATRTNITFAGTAFGNSLELTSDKLTPGTTYFWRVSLVVKSGDNTAYVTSEVGEFTPKAAPGVITVTSPANNATNVAISGINFSWEPDASATKYQVLVYESTNLETPVIDKTVDADGDGIQSAQFADVPALQYSTEYKWRVIGYNGTKVGELNDLTDFVTQGNPISLIDPVQISNPSQEWFVIFQNTTGSQYRRDATIEIASSRAELLAVGPYEERQTPIVYKATTIASSFTVPESLFEDQTTYYWRLSGRTMDGSNNFASSDVGVFAIVRTPSQPEITSPEDGSIDVPLTNITFNWGAVDFADSYSVELKKSGSETIVNQSDLTQTTYTYTGAQLENDTNYEFTVTPLNGERSGFPKVIGFKTKKATPSKPAISLRITLTFTVTVPLSDLQIQSLIKELVATYCEVYGLEDCSRITFDVGTTSKVIHATNQEISDETVENNASAMLLWSTPADISEEFPIKHYAIQYRTTGAEFWNIISRPQSTDTLAVITGLKPNTNYDFRIAGVNENGIGEYSDIIETESISFEDVEAFIKAYADSVSATSIEVDEIPTEFALFQNYPNPFNPTTTIRFALPEPSEVQLEVYSILGQRIAVLTTGLKPAGYHSLQLDASRWASGTYIYRLRAGDRVFTKKLLLLK